MSNFYVQYLLSYNTQLTMKLLNLNFKCFNCFDVKNKSLLQDSKVLVRDQEDKREINAHSHFFGNMTKIPFFFKKKLFKIL